MTVTSIRDAWAEVQKIFPTHYKHDASRSERAGYPIYYSTAADVNAWISDLGNRLEVNLPDGKRVDIWIQAPAEAATSASTEDTESATRDTIHKISGGLLLWKKKLYLKGWRVKGISRWRKYGRLWPPLPPPG